MAKQNKQFKPTTPMQLPAELQETFQKATKLEWITVVYISSVILVMMVTMQSSQAMKATWLEDVLSIVPAISFLVAKQYYNRPANEQFPYGYHRIYSIAFQLGAFALLSVGLFLFYDSVVNLIKVEHPTIGSVSIFGYRIWMGWLMIAALLYSCIPSIILGKKKLPLADKLHNKILFTDAHTQQADWQTALAAIGGILGVGFGLWWADSAAACLISINVIRDGYERLKGAMLDLIDQVPTNLENSQKHPLVKKVYGYFDKLPWVADVKIRMREAGEIFFTEVFIVPKSNDKLLENMEKAHEEVKGLDWKMHDVVIIPLREFPDENSSSDA
jgi:cation diffusion facilitator family transporter